MRQVYNYQTSPAPTIKLPTYILYTSLSNTPTEDETANNNSSSVTAEIVSIDTTLQIIKLKNHSNSFTEENNKLSNASFSCK